MSRDAQHRRGLHRLHTITVLLTAAPLLVASFFSGRVVERLEHNAERRQIRADYAAWAIELAEYRAEREDFRRQRDGLCRNFFAYYAIRAWQEDHAERGLETIWRCPPTVADLRRLSDAQPR